MTRFPALLLSLCFCATIHAQDAKTLADYRAEAQAAVDGISAKESIRLLGEDDVVFVDIRDSAEVEKSGKVLGAVHIPRGMLEFYIDPASSMHHKLFSTQNEVIFYCETGGRSLLAAKLAKDMGVGDARYIEGGFRAWSRAGGETVK